MLNPQSLILDPIRLSTEDLDLFRTAISAYNGSVNSLSEATYKKLDKDCQRMEYIIDRIEDGHTTEYVKIC